MEKVVFETEEGGWSDDGGFGEDISDDFFASSLGILIRFSMYLFSYD